MKNLQADLNETLSELIHLLSSIHAEKINTIPFEGSWTAGQLAQHMILSDGGFVESMNGPVEETKRRPDELIENIRTIFLDFTTKLKSPDVVKPPKITYDKHELLDSLTKIKENLSQTLETADLTKTCVGFKVPFLGHLTRLESAHFILYHTQRHIHQLKNISQKLASGNNVSIA